MAILKHMSYYHLHGKVCLPYDYSYYESTIVRLWGIHVHLVYLGGQNVPSCELKAYRFRLFIVNIIDRIVRTGKLGDYHPLVC